MTLKEAVARKGGDRMVWLLAAQVLEVQQAVAASRNKKPFAEWTVEEIVDFVTER